MKRNRRRGKSISSGDTIALAGMVITLAGGVSTIFFYLIFMPTLKEPESENYQALRNRLAGHSQREEVYRASLTRFLRWLDRFFEGPEEEPGLPDPEKLTLRDRFWQRVLLRKYSDVSKPASRLKDWQPNPWSAAAYDRCLLMAVLYPIVAAIIGWVLFGTGGELARVIGFTDVSEKLYRVVFVVLVFATVAGFVKFLRGGYRWDDWMALMVAVSTASLGQSILKYLFPQVQNSVAVVIAIAIVMVGAIAIFISGTVAVAGAGAFVGAFAGASAFAIAFAVIGVVSVAVVGAGAFAVVSAVVSVVAFAIAKKFDRLGLFLLIVSLAQIAAIGSFVFYAGGKTGSARSFFLLIAIVILPLVNAPFDWASTGLTRFLLRKNVSEKLFGKRVIWSGCDFLGALVLLVGLCATMVIALELANGIAKLGGYSGTIVNVHAILTDLHYNHSESRHFWLYFAVLSTLIPTFVHLAIWVASTATFQSKRLSAWAVPLMENNFAQGATHRNILGMALTAQVMAAGAVSLTLLFVILWLLASLFGLGTYLLDMLLWLSGVCQGWFA